MKRLFILSAIAVGFSAIAALGQPKQHGYLAVTLGRDTIAVEEFFMDGQGLHGTSVAEMAERTAANFHALFRP